MPVRIPSMIYGADGSIAVTGQSELQVAVPDPSGHRGATNVETIEAAALPDHYRSGPAYFAHCLLNERPFEGIVSAEISRDAQEILEAGIESMEAGGEVGLPLSAHLR